MIRRVIPTAIGSLVAALALVGCGTATFDNTFVVSVDDGSGRLGTDRVQVAVFDAWMSGIPEFRNEDKGTVGTTSPGDPYVTTLFTTDTKFVGDSSPPEDLRAALYLPQVHDDAYFAIILKPEDGRTIEYEAPYVNFNAGYEPLGEKPKTAPPMPMTVTTASGDRGWEVAIRVDLPSGP